MRVPGSLATDVRSLDALKTGAAKDPSGCGRTSPSKGSGALEARAAKKPWRYSFWGALKAPPPGMESGADGGENLCQPYKWRDILSPDAHLLLHDVPLQTD
jgi:hypothetical protein